MKRQPQGKHMGREIERKFLPAGEGWREAVAGVHGAHLRQGYLSSRKEAVVRVRVADDAAFLTIKGAGARVGDGAECRAEFEYPIPMADAQAMLDAMTETPPLEKIRYRLPMEGLVWEVDEFLGRHAGLVLLEMELTHPEQAFPRPEWVGREVTGDPRYSNAVLIGSGSECWGKGPF